MFRVRALLTPAELQQLDSLLKAGTFSDGRITAGGAGQSIKSNAQLDPSDPNGPRANQLIKNALMRNEAFKSYAMPYRVSDLTFSRYEAGMHYGEHTDNAVNWMSQQVIRSDMSFTIFLSEPGEYEGGELIARILDEEVAVKGNRGDMVVYPSGLIHRVNEVTSGARRVALGWLQSTVPEQEKREILRAVFTTRNEILVAEGRSAHFQQLDFVFSNLQRMWTRV